MQYAHVTQRALLFDGMYVADELSFVLKLAGFLVVAVALLYSRAYLENHNILRGEYYVLALTALLGIFVLVSANSLLTVYLGVELLALSVYAMVAFDRDSGIAAEAAMKYFVLGAIASGALLYGMSLIYGLTGTLDLGEIAVRLSAPSSLGVMMGLVFIVVAVAFKLGAVPFHMWLPDVYEGAPTSVTLFIGTVPKLAYFALALRLLAQGLAGMSVEWTQMLAPLAVLTLVVGNVLAIVQTNLKRMLAYSTIANVGFIVLGFVAGTRGRLRRGPVLHARVRARRARFLRRDPAGEPQGLRGRPARRLPRAVPARSAARIRDDAADVLNRRGAAAGGLLGEAAHLPGAVGDPSPVARDHRCRDVSRGRLLLPARHQADVLR